MMDFLNYLAHLHIWHCQMQDKKYLWLQLERIPNLLSEAGGFSHSTSIQTLHTLTWLGWKAKACSRSRSSVALHIILWAFLCSCLKGWSTCRPHISPMTSWRYRLHSHECHIPSTVYGHSCHHRTHQIFPSTANFFHAVSGLHFQIVVLVTAAQHNSEGTGLLLFTRAT